MSYQQIKDRSATLIRELRELAAATVIAANAEREANVSVRARQDVQ